MHGGEIGLSASADHLSSPSEDRFPSWLSLCLIAACFAWFLHWSWGKWTDPYIDFGNELYIAWQIGEGRSLYADMAHRNGPFSHYVNTLWFQLFGVSIRTLVWCNLAILVSICAMLLRVFRLACGRGVATLVVCFFLSVFAFSQYGLTGNFNYLTPYQHAQTHGIALGLAMILALVEAERRSSGLWCGWAGIALGLLYLGKVEIFVPALGVAFCGLWVVVRSGRGEATRAAWPVLCFGLGAFVVMALALILLALSMPMDRAWLGVLGNWAYLGESLLSDRFYMAGAGFDDFWGNAGIALMQWVWVLLFALLVAGVDRFAPIDRSSPAGRPWIWSVALGFAIMIVCYAADSIIPWKSLARALPATTGMLLVVLWLPALRWQLAPRYQVHWLSLALFSVYALGLLGKMLLNARVGHYGFVLAMPATLLLVASLASVVPGFIRRRYGGGDLAAAAAVGASIAAAFYFWGATDRIYARKDFKLGKGADVITVEGPRFMARGLVISRTLEALENMMHEDDTLLVLPEGITFNYWLRRRNPTPYHLFLPTELQAFGGEKKMLRAIEANPPDFVVLAHREHMEFGVGSFGVDPRNGQELMKWVKAHYRGVAGFGAPPFRTRNFGTQILRRVPMGLESRR